MKPINCESSNQVNARFYRLSRQTSNPGFQPAFIPRGPSVQVHRALQLGWQYSEINVLHSSAAELAFIEGVIFLHLFCTAGKTPSCSSDTFIFCHKRKDGCIAQWLKRSPSKHGSQHRSAISVSRDDDSLLVQLA